MLCAGGHMFGCLWLLCSEAEVKMSSSPSSGLFDCLSQGLLALEPDGIPAW